MGTQPSLRAIYTALAACTDAGHWWPAKTRFEILVGAVLTQNTSWTNVERCIANLAQADALTPEAILGMAVEDLQVLIKPSGYWRVKAGYLQGIAEWFITYDHQAAAMDDHTLRRSLLSVHGVGEETADDILLYAYDRPVFIYDAYARKLLAAAGLGEFTTYRKAKLALDPQVQVEGFTTEELAHFHGLIVQAGKTARSQGGWQTYWPTIAPEQ